MELRYARLVAYDIEDDRRRQRVARFLEKQGMRIQKSVFVVNIRNDRLDNLVRQLRRLCGDQDIVDILPVCANCRGHSVRIGPETETAYVILGSDKQIAQQEEAE